VTVRWQRCGREVDVGVYHCGVACVRDCSAATAVVTGHYYDCRVLTWLMSQVWIRGMPTLTQAARGLHSPTSQLNLDRVCHKDTP
jgi:hypothetical protein